MNDYTYKGAIIQTPDESFLFITRQDDYWYMIGLNEGLDTYKDISSKSIIVSSIKIFDGTENISIEKAIEDENQDVFIATETYGAIETIVPDIMEFINLNPITSLSVWMLIEKFFDDFPNSEEKYKSLKKMSFSDFLKGIKKD